MLFNSFEFVLGFLPVTLAGFFLLGRWRRDAAAFFLAAASVFFYGWWDSRYVALLFVSIAMNYTAGRFMAGASTRPRARTALIFGIAANLLILAYYKYAAFFVNSFDALAGMDWTIGAIVLPLGISFYTFTQIAFLVDTYRGEASEYKFTHYVLFVTYFPHLIAGPIIHHKQVMPQFADPKIYRPKSRLLALGAFIFTVGLMKKVILADSFSVYATPVFDAAETGQQIDAIVSWIGIIAYSLQIYFDFSGYSDMAVGLSLLFGVKLPINFNSPYKAVNISDFWRRWHMTLSRFLRDYLYISLGGNRRGRARRYINLAVTMLLGGLWHGANWTFVVWGGLHGFYLIAHQAWRSAARRLGLPGFGLAGRMTATLLTFAAVLLAWVFFRAETFHGAATLLAGMAGANGVLDGAGVSASLSALLGYDESLSRLAVILAGGLGICFLLPNSNELAAYLKDAIAKVRWQTIGAVTTVVFLLLTINAARGVSEFIYFNF